MSRLNIVALDLSLTSTGVCLPDGTTTRIRTVSVPKGDEHAQTERLDGIVLQVETFVKLNATELVVIEGFSFGSQNSMAHVIGGLGYMVRDRLNSTGVPWLTVAPKKLKKYATGNGNAPKDQVIADAVRRFPDCPSQNDEIDAYVMWAMAHDGTGHPVVDLPQTHRAALTGVEWPFNPEAQP